MDEIFGKPNFDKKKRFCEMYSLIIKTLPQFQSALSDKKVF
jgi:hypothetical protein